MKVNYPFKGLTIVLPFLFFSLLPCFTSAQAGCSTGLTNGGFEAWDVAVPGLGFFNSSNGWTSQSNTIEVWGSGWGGVPAYQGTHFVELNSGGPDILSQDLATTPGATYNWSVAHRGRDGVDVANLEFGPPTGPFVAIQVMSTGNGAWHLYSGAYTVPAGQTTTRVRFRSISYAGGCASCANFLDAFDFQGIDSDGDGALDCVDGCPNDVNKTAPGQCGCGVADTDRDGDGSADCVDGCPDDGGKTAPGICGCGTADTDTDGDLTADCNDGCPNDANKTAPGQCGCGNADTDTDSDGIADCNDGCPNDANKTAPGQCGCGFADTDTDGDGTADCVDGCPNNAGKTAPGQCGCAVADTDSDGDGIANCHDNCDFAANSGQQDSDCDGIGDACDVCPGGDDNGPCNATSLPSSLPPTWICSNNNNTEKIKVCHGGVTLCVSENAAATHLAHGDFLGPCVSCTQSFAGQVDNIQYDAGQSLNSDLEVYPNPAGDELNIQLNIQGGAGTIITISDNFGRTILTQPWEANRRNLSIDISDNHFVNGIYYVVASTEKQVLVQRFVISK